MGTKNNNTKNVQTMGRNSKKLWIVIISVLVALAIAAAVAVGAFLGLQNSGKITPISPSEQDIKVIGTCEGYDVYYEELRYVTLLYKSVMEQEYGEGIFDGEVDQKYKDELTEYVMSNITANYAVLSLCNDYLIYADDEEMKEASEEALKDFVDALGGFDKYKKELDKQNMTDHYMRFNLLVNSCQKELWITLTDNNIIETAPEKMVDIIKTEFIHTQHIFIEKKDGQSVDEALADAILVRDTLRDDPEKLDEMIGKYSNDVSTESELYFTRGEMMKAYEDAAFSLEYPNAVSDVVETAEGFYVIMRLPMDEEYVLNHITELTNQYANVQFYNIIDEAQAKIKIELNEYGKSIDLTKIK